MPLVIATKLFGHAPEPIDHVYMMALERFATARNKPIGSGVTSAQKRRKRSLGVLTQQPDMEAINCLLAFKKVAETKYGILYSGVHNQFKRNFESGLHSRMLGFMEIISQIFRLRAIELDMVLKNQNKKEIKISHAIRDCGEFIPAEYEAGRLEAVEILVLALPESKKFNLLAGSEELIS